MPEEVSGSDLRQRVQSLLDPGESILWVGQPDASRFWGEVAAVVTLGVLLLAAGGALLVVAWPDRIYLLLAVGLGLSAFGCFCALAPWRVRRRLRQGTYALTNRRALILHGVGWSWQDTVPTLSESWYSFGPQELSRRVLKRRSARRTDLVFGTESQRVGRGKSMAVEVGFIGLADPAEVEELLEQRFPRL
jgi:hypothetical protein